MPFDLTIVSPDGIAFRGQVDTVILPGSQGDFGVLEFHERFLSSLRIGQVEIQTGNDTIHAVVSAGFAEVQGSSVRVLVDACELSSEIDVARAELAKERAERALSELRESAEEAQLVDEYEAALQRAVTRIAAAER